MFNRDGKNPSPESRIEDIERVVKQNGEMLNALRDGLVAHEDELLALTTALAVSLLLLTPEKRAMLESAMSDFIRKWPDRGQAEKLRSNFVEKLNITISD